jgi:ornithine decarboxylase
MRYEQMFRFLLVENRDGLTAAGRKHLDCMTEAIRQAGITVKRAAGVEDATHVVNGDTAIGCILIEWGSHGDTQRVRGFVAGLRHRGFEVPVFLLAHRHQIADISGDLAVLVTGTVFEAEDTPEFVARNLVEHLRQYAASLKTPFFGAMVDYADQGNQLWTCPGHNGGVFYRKSPIGQVFVEHLGEAIFRNDLDNSVVEMGDLLIPEGPARQAEVEAAKIFGAERTYFVLNGTSTSNKIVLNAIVAPGDLVLFDRNNHKAAVHGALLLGGGIPVYLETTRNAQGLIGPIAWDALDEAAIRETIRAHPLVKDPEHCRRERPFRAVVIEQCTYDGTIYNVDVIMRKLGPLCDYILFDEAWGGFMKFHPLFESHYAMSLEPEAGDPGIIATQSTHKQLAGFSQASQIHVKDRHMQDRRRVEEHRFNELYMLHASTSPFYPLFASLDVGAQMMKGRQGEALWDETIRLGIELRKRLRSLKKEFEARDDANEAWFFDPFVPDSFEEFERGLVAWENIDTNHLASEARYWKLGYDTWHGFPSLPQTYAMTDPNKLTLLTPGLDRKTGNYTERGIPAPVLAEYLREQRIVPEKNDFNSILFLLTPGLEAGKAGNLIAALTRFHRLYAENAPMAETMPEFVRRNPRRYDAHGLRDICQELHDFYRRHSASRLQAEQFTHAHLPEIVVSPRDAWEKLLRNDVDYIPLNEADGRVAATLALVYPPGIGVVVPGERYGGRAQPMLDYLKMFEEASNRFPGFENEIQGVYRERQPDGRVRLFTYVLRGL